MGKENRIKEAIAFAAGFKAGKNEQLEDDFPDVGRRHNKTVEGILGRVV